MKFRRRRKGDSTINLTPLIDVVFLLLIFFMVSTTFTRETRLEIALPEASGEPSELPPQSIEITVSREGHYHVNGRTLANGDVTTLVKALEFESKGDSNLPVTITADANAAHQSVVTAMDAAGRLGFSRLNIATQQPAND